MSGMIEIVNLVDEALMASEDSKKLESIGEKVSSMMAGKPLFATPVTS
jgi:hypothetical protein